MDFGGRDMPPLNPAAPRMPRRPPARRAATFGRWLRRGFVAGALVGLCGAGWFGWQSGRLPVLLTSSRETFIAMSAKGGFRVEDVEVAGRRETDPKALLAAAGIKRGDPILAFDPEAARKQIESLPWVSSATVERHLPDTVTIMIEERKPIALWQHNERISLIDADGNNLGPVAIESAPQLPLVVGGDAPAHAAELLAMLADHPDLAHRVQASSWIGSRRWDLKLDNGIEIRLPETGVAEAIAQVADAETSSRLFEKNIAAIDLRLSGKMIVRLAHDAQLPTKTKQQQGI
jgi:cell division protein FtsQ